MVSDSDTFSFILSPVAAASLMPGFHHSVAVLPLPFRRSVVPLPFFRYVATVAVAGENGNAGNVFPYT